MRIFFTASCSLLIIMSLSAYLQTADAARPAYVYDNAEIISSQSESLLNSYLRQVDDSASVEIIIWTTPSFYGHGIKKEGVELHERDMLANFFLYSGPTGVKK